MVRAAGPAFLRVWHRSHPVPPSRCLGAAVLFVVIALDWWWGSGPASHQRCGSGMHSPARSGTRRPEGRAGPSLCCRGGWLLVKGV